MPKSFDYVIVGAGIAGCSTAFFLSKYSNSILLIDRNCDIAQGASGAAGAFLSPLLGKPNKFKDLVTKAIKFSTQFYKEQTPNEINNCGVVRIPKNEEDREKFDSYKPYMDFDYKEEDDGYFFEIGSQVNSYNICKILTKNIEKLFNYEVQNISKENEYWALNDDIRCKNLILSTGADVRLIDEKYFNIRAVWGQKIDIHTTTDFKKNYHKACSISHATKLKNSNDFKVSIGATHRRENFNLNICNHCLKENSNYLHDFNKELIEEDIDELISKANDIKTIENVNVVDVKIGPRASSLDYFPMLGELIDSKKTIEKFPHLINGSHIKNDMLSCYENFYVINGVGGRGYVLSPYLAFMLVEFIINKKDIDEEVLTHRLFKRWVKKYKLKND